eukprot:SAG31_NODE_4479_length_3200_cov_2.358916_4_plen_131_part_00
MQTGWELRTHAPQHSVYESNYKSAAEHFGKLNEVASTERSEGVLDPRGPFTGPPFVPYHKIPRGTAIRGTKVRPTTDAGGPRSTIDLWDDLDMPDHIHAQLNKLLSEQRGPTPSHKANHSEQTNPQPRPE